MSETILPNWQTDLSEFSINDENWRCHVSVMVEANLKSHQYLEIFNEAAIGGTRKSVKLITLNGILQTIKIYANDLKGNRNSAGLPEELASYQEACAEAIKYANKDGTFNIPAEMLAQLVKFEVLRLKYEWMTIAQREILINEEIENEFNSMWKSKTCPAMEKKQGLDKNLRKPSRTTQTKLNTKLHKHGEEWKDIKFIDDTPKGGPQLYIAITGFHDIDVLMNILKLDIPLVSIIKIYCDLNVEDIIDKSKLHTVTRPSRMIETRSFSISSAINKFWNNLSSVMHEQKQNELFQHIAFITYYPNKIDELSDSSITVVEDPEIIQKKIIFDQISFLMYDINDIIRQHIKYIRNMKEIKVLDESPKVDLEELDVYNQFMDTVPSECISIPIIIHWLLEEVCSRVNININELNNTTDTQANINNSDLSVSTTSLPKKGENVCKKYKASGYHKTLMKIFEETRNKHKRKSQTESTLNVASSKVLSFRDTIQLRTHYIQNLSVDLLQIAINILKYSAIPLLWNRISLTDEQILVFKKQANNLLNTNTDISTDVKMYALALKTILNLHCDYSKGYIPTVNDFLKYRSFKYNIADNDYPKFIIEPDKISTQSSESVILNDIIRCTDIDPNRPCTCDCFDLEEFNFVEQFSVNSLLQLLFDISNTYQRIDYYYFSTGDFLILICHNDIISQHGIIVNDWQTKISTPVCLRDFVNFIVMEEAEWLKNEEIKYEQLCKLEDEIQNKKIAIMSEESTSVVNKGNHEGNFLFSDYLLPGSVKYKKYLEESKALTVLVDKKGLLTQSSKSIKSIKPTTVPYPQFKETLPENSVYRPLSLRTAIEDEPFHFIGYDLGSSRVHISGTTTDIYSQDGTNIKVNKSGWYFQDEMLSIILTKSNHKLYLYSVANKMPQLAKPFNFHIETAKGIILAFAKSEIPPQPKPKYEINELFQIPFCLIGKSIPHKSREIINVFEEEIPEKLHHLASENRTKKNIELDHSVIVPEKMNARIELEKKFGLNTSKQSIAPNLLKSLATSCTKSQILLALKDAKTKNTPCYKIISSKLHSYKYLKRIKPHVSICAESLIQKLLKMEKPHMTKTKKSFQKYRKNSLKSKPSGDIYQQLNFDFKASWPTGLMIETVPSVFDYDPFYVRQYYISKGPSCKSIKDETKRCFLRNGTLIIFKENEKMTILCPDSSYFSCCIGVTRKNSLNIKSHSFQHSKRTFKSIVRKRKNLIKSSESLAYPVSRHLYQKYLKHCLKIAKEKLKQNPYFVPIPEYTVTTPKGTKCTIRGNRIASFPSRYIVQSATDYFEGETFTEREDGTSSLLNADGVLVTCFPDGTRITTSFVIDENDVFCEFSDEELNSLLEKCFNFTPEYENTLEEESKFDCLQFDGFLSVFLSCTFEHPNYGTVSYNGCNKNVKIYMPDGVEITSTQDGNYSGYLDTETRFSLDLDKILFEKKICGSHSLTTVNIVPFIKENLSENFSNNSSNDISMEDDQNSERDKSNSKTNSSDVYIENIDMYDRKVNIYFTGEIAVSENFNESIEENKCVKNKINFNKSRVFILKRNLTGAEFLSELEVNKLRSDILKRKGTVLEDLNENNRSCDSYLTLLDYEECNYSTEWLMPYKIPKIAPKHLIRKEMKPTTYLFNSWLSPLPNQKIDRKNKTFNFFEETLKTTTEKVALRRVFLKLSNSKQSVLLHADNIVNEYNKKVTTQEKNLEDLSYTGKHDVQVEEKCSAFLFKERWNLRQLECERFKEMLRNAAIPQYFSPEMEQLIFSKKKIPCTKRNTVQNNINQKIYSNTSQETLNTEYVPDLDHISEQWKRYHEDTVSENIETSEIHKKETKIEPLIKEDIICMCKNKSQTSVLEIPMILLSDHFINRYITGFGEMPQIKEMKFKLSANEDNMDSLLSESKAYSI